MHQKSVKHLLATLVLYACCINSAMAWNDFGHMMIAEVAYDRLNSRTKVRVMSLLKLNPMYGIWRKQFASRLPPNSRNRMIFMSAATWPDSIKGDLRHYQADGPNDGETPIAPLALQNIGYKDHNLHKYWHYDDNFFSLDGTKLPEQQQPNAKTQMKEFRSVLRSNASDELKSYDLTWLIHLIGDVHQPLHSASIVSFDYPASDYGGTSINLLKPASDLHSYWDASAGTGSIENALKSAQRLPTADKLLVSDLNETHWENEAVEIAKTVVYGPGLIRLKNHKYRISNTYLDKSRKISRQQVELAGERLAAVLNQDLK